MLVAGAAAAFAAVAAAAAAAVVVGMCVGAIAGLATVTPAAGFILPWGAFIIGILAALVCYGCCELKKRLRWDDTLDVWGVHGCGGFLGTIMLGALADDSVNEGTHRSGKLSAILFTIGKLTRLKPSKDEVAIGLDLAIFG